MLLISFTNLSIKLFCNCFVDQTWIGNCLFLHIVNFYRVIWKKQARVHWFFKILIAIKIVIYPDGTQNHTAAFLNTLLNYLWVIWHQLFILKYVS